MKSNQILETEELAANIEELPILDYEYFKIVYKELKTLAQNISYGNFQVDIEHFQSELKSFELGVQKLSLEAEDLQGKDFVKKMFELNAFIQKKYHDINNKFKSYLLNPLPENYSSPINKNIQFFLEKLNNIFENIFEIANSGKEEEDNDEIKNIPRATSTWLLLKNLATEDLRPDLPPIIKSSRSKKLLGGSALLGGVGGGVAGLFFGLGVLGVGTFFASVFSFGVFPLTLLLAGGVYLSYKYYKAKKLQNRFETEETYKEPVHINKLDEAPRNNVTARPRGTKFIFSAIDRIDRDESDDGLDSTTEESRLSETNSVSSYDSEEESRLSEADSELSNDPELDDSKMEEQRNEDEDDFTIDLRYR